MGAEVISRAESIVMVVNRTGAAADNLTELIQFMDSPRVCAASPSEWQEQVGARRLEAVFVCPDLSDGDIRRVFDGIGTLDPNIPIVVLTENLDS